MMTFYWYDEANSLTSYSQGTGFMISNRHVVTVSHNLFRKKDGVKCNNCVIEFKEKGTIYRSQPSKKWKFHKEFDLALISLEQYLPDFVPEIEIATPDQISRMNRISSHLFVVGYSIDYRTQKGFQKDELHLLPA